MASLRGPFWAMAASLTAAILIGHQTWAVIVLGLYYGSSF